MLALPKAEQEHKTTSGNTLPAQVQKALAHVSARANCYGPLAAWFIALAFVAVELQRVAGQVTVRYPDFPVWAERAAQFDLGHLADWRWVDGLYPLGYPLLLRLGVALGLDVLRTAFLMSIVGGFLGLLGTFWLVRQMTHNWTLALFTQAILACTAHYLFFASLDSTDMLASGLLIYSLAVLFSEGRKERIAFAAGLLAGLSYLVRYTGLVPILLCTLYLAGLAWTQRKRSGWTPPLAYLVGAGIGAAPQLIASLLIKGNPLYSHQAHNLWFHLTGGSDYLFEWRAVPMDISWWEVVRTYPRELVTHWLDTFGSFWTTQDAAVLDTPFALLMHAGLLYTVLAAKELERSTRAFIGLYVVGSIAGLSFIRLDKRFLIPLMPVLALTTVYFLWRVLPDKLDTRRGSLPIRIPVLLALAIWSASHPVDFMNSNPRDNETLRVSNMLHAAGMMTADQVYSTHLRYHDVADPWKSRFTMAFVRAPRLESYDALLELLKQGDYSFLIYDRETGTSLYPELEYLLHPENRPPGLTPVYVNEKRKHAIYRVLDAGAPTFQSVSATWVNGIELEGYETFLSDDEPRHEGGQTLGVYLHWRATRPQTRTLKVFVHVLDAGGQLVAQHDGLPALWTWPTDQWPMGETVVDFHPVSFESALSSGAYTVWVGFYTDDTGRVALTDAAGAAAGDAFELITLTIP